MKLGEWVEVEAEYFTDHPSAQNKTIPALVTEITSYEDEWYAMLYSPMFKYPVAYPIDYGE